MLKLVVNDLAQQDIDKSAKWYRQFGNHLSLRFLGEVHHKLSLIQYNPRHYPVLYRSVHQAVLRKFPYALYYQILDDQIQVIACSHNARNRDFILSERT